jgi:hypothetical protein
LVYLSALVGISWGFFIGTLSSTPQILVNLNSGMTIPLLILSGFFAKSSNFAPYLKPFEYLSFFKYLFQTLIHNEYSDNQPLICANFKIQCHPLAYLFVFPEPFYVSFIAIGCLLIFYSMIGFLFLYFFSRPKV